MRRLLLPALGLLGSGCLLLGAVLDWSGVAYSSTLDRRIVFVSGLVMLVLVAAAFFRWQRVLILALVPAVVSLNMGLVNYRDIDGKQFEFAAYPKATVGVGIYLVLVGGLLALVVGAGSALPRRWVPARPLDS